METRKLGESHGRGSASDGEVRPEARRRGVSAAPGIVIGSALVLDAEAHRIPDTPVATEQVEKELETFRAALAATRQELHEIKASLARQLGDDHARIFDAHLLILDDVMVVDDTEALIRNENRNAAWAFQHVVANVISSFQDIEDEYLKDRFADIVDVKKRVLAKLLGRERKSSGPTEPSVVVAHDLSPSETAQLDRRNVLAYATDLGGRTSHTAILARSQGVAAVVGLENLSHEIRTGDLVIVDGNTGTVIVNPLESTLETYQREKEHYEELEKQLLTLTAYPAETLDSRKVELKANLDAPAEVEFALSYGAMGVGLFRTEYYFIAKDQLPSEEDQYQVYRAVVEKMAGKPVTIRVLDIGGDKIAGYLQGSEELNPFLGWRGIRFLLARKDVFKTQLRAIFRASAHGNVRIMLPLVVELDEVSKAKEICAEVREELAENRQPVAEDIPFGIMIETPSAVMLAADLARHVDFFSIGTNDLIQYTMAVDRGNTKISHLYQHLHPSILRMIRATVDAGHKHKVPVAVCGEMAVDPLSTMLLVGMQVDELSCSPNMIPEIKKIVRSVTYDECKSLVKRVLRYSTADRIESETRRVLMERCPDLPTFLEGK